MKTIADIKCVTEKVWENPLSYHRAIVRHRTRKNYMLHRTRSGWLAHGNEWKYGDQDASREFAHHAVQGCG